MHFSFVIGLISLVIVGRPSLAIGAIGFMHSSLKVKRAFYPEAPGSLSLNLSLLWACNMRTNHDQGQPTTE